MKLTEEQVIIEKFIGTTLETFEHYTQKRKEDLIKGLIGHQLKGGRDTNKAFSVTRNQHYIVLELAKHDISTRFGVSDEGNVSITCHKQL